MNFITIVQTAWSEIGFYEQRLLVIVVAAIVAFTFGVAHGDLLSPLDHVREVLGTAWR